jgi:large subunit ribosomal protein L4|tara:strand:- start:648 stop:1277 length:630 start_codon:yes stop_codon:yes gene_type:complete
MEYKLYNISGSETSDKLKLNKDVFGIEPNSHCVYLTLKSELASMRQGTSSSKTRAEVSGGGVKPWKQKGTGRARAGSIRNPSRVHGGVAFGPKPRKYSLKINKKVKKLAKQSVLSQKLLDKKLIIIDDFSISSLKTKEFSNILNGFDLLDKKTTILINEPSDNMFLGSQNLKNIYLSKASHASAGDLLDCDVLVLDKNAAEYYNNTLKK